VTKEENKEKERRTVEEAINKGNLNVLDEVLSPDFVYHGPGGTEVKGPEEYKKFLASLRDMYPDIHVEIKNILAEGNLVATRTMSTFTFTGKVGDIAPTDRRVAMMGSILDRFDGGKLVETWELYDRLDLYQQLGLIPAKPSGSE
jgi:predicted ester cyclase